MTRPHVSAALQHLRRSIITIGVVLSLCLIAQLVIWGIVHFTDARHYELKPEEGARQEQVVIRPSTVSPEAVTGVVAPPPHLRKIDPVNPNIVMSSEDRVLHRTSEVVQTVGTVAAITLMILMLQGVVIAGGASLPGVEMAVTATTWTLVVGIFCMPLGSLLPGLPYHGVFSPYETLIASSEAFKGKGAEAPGPVVFYGTHLALPLLLLGSIGAAMLRFHLGIESGVMLTSLSQVDEKLEREIRQMRLGALATSRAVGALNTAFGDPLPTNVPTEEEEPIGVARSMKEPPIGRPLKRPV